MFTRASSNFGVWRASHRSQRRTGLGANYSMVMAMASMAFVAWLTFFLLFKIRGDFYFFETSQLNIPDSSSFRDSSLLIGQRPPAFAVGLLRNKIGKVVVLFDDGRTFEYPQQRPELEAHLQRLAQNQEFLAMLTKKPTETIGRIQIWADRSLSFSVVREVSKMFSSLGFDEFDFALTLSSESHRRQAGLLNGAAP